MEEVIDVPAEQLQIGVGDAEARLGQVADDADDALVIGSPAVAQLLQPTLRALPHEHVDRALALEQQLNQIAPDEAGCTGDEVGHGHSPLYLLDRYGPYTRPMNYQAPILLPARSGTRRNRIRPTGRITGRRLPDGGFRRR